MKIIVILIALSVLSACGGPSTPEANIPSNRIVRVAVAPDGTTLWGTNTGGRYVYFASSGTQTTQSCGKNCTRSVNVPTAPQ